MLSQSVEHHECEDVDALFAGFYRDRAYRLYRYSAEGWQDVTLTNTLLKTLKMLAGITTSRGTATWAGEFKYQDDHIIAGDSSADGS